MDKNYKSLFDNLNKEEYKSNNKSNTKGKPYDNVINELLNFDKSKMNSVIELNDPIVETDTITYEITNFNKNNLKKTEIKVYNKEETISPLIKEIQSFHKSNLKKIKNPLLTEIENFDKNKLKKFNDAEIMCNLNNDVYYYNMNYDYKNKFKKSVFSSYNISTAYIGITMFCLISIQLTLIYDMFLS